MQQVYRDIALAAPPVVLGRRLLPFSLAHAYALTVLESPTIAGGAMGIGDLALAVYVCARPGWPFARLARDARSDGWARRMRLWGAVCRGRGWARDVAAWQAYVAAYTGRAEMYAELVRGGRTIKPERARVPWPLACAARLIPLLGEAGAWNCPVCRAFAYLDASAEDQSFLVPDDRVDEEGAA